MKVKKFIEISLEMLINLFANFFLWFLIWTGSVIALINSGEFFLAILLILSGFAKVYVENKKNAKDNSEEKQ